MRKKILALVLMLVMAAPVVALAGCGTDLADYKATAKAEIESYAVDKGEENYSGDKWQLVQAAVKAGKAAIDAAKSKAPVDTAVTEAIIMIDVVQKEGEMEEWTLLDSNNCCVEFEQSESYAENLTKSIVAYDAAIELFTTIDGKYMEDFGGVFVDGNGIHNICVVGNREPIKSDFLIYKQVENSRNFLDSVVEELGSVSQQFSIWMAGTCERCNGVVICIENINKIPLIISYLKTKGLFNTETMKFFFGESEIALH